MSSELYAADEGLHGRNVLRQLLVDIATQLFTINSPTWYKVSFLQIIYCQLIQSYTSKKLITDMPSQLLIWSDLIDVSWLLEVVTQCTYLQSSLVS